MFSIFVIVIVVLDLAQPTTSLPIGSNENELDDSHWQAIARERLGKNLDRHHEPAKNVIFFIGDGMSLSTVTATRLFKRQVSAVSSLAWDNFEHVGLVATDNMDSQVGESGACATALMSGVKARYETLGLGRAARLDDCFASLTGSARVTSIADWAQQKGKSTGFVTTTRVTHATPAALYAHSANRYWESDDKLPTTHAAFLCKDIARQLVEDETGRNLNVILGGGKRHFLSHESSPDVGRRLDGRNLIESWQDDKTRRGLQASYVSSRQELLNLRTENVDYLLGLFNANHLAYETERTAAEPALWEMATKALEVLKHNPNGYVLLVEAGRIDHAHHQNNAYRALTETMALDRTVTTVLEHVNLSDTLVIVTSDHSQVMTFGAQMAASESSVLDFDDRPSDVDGLLYTKLLYANGPGSHVRRDARRSNISQLDPVSLDYQQQSAVPLRWSTHAGEEVPLYATGSGAHLFSGSYHQTFVPWALSRAACIGPFADLCSFDNLEGRSFDFTRSAFISPWLNYLYPSGSASLSSSICLVFLLPLSLLTATYHSMF